MENPWIQIITIFIAGATGIWKGVPVGLAMQADPFLTAGFTALGSIVAVLVILFSGEPVKQWILNRYGRKALDKKRGKFLRLVDRYGVAGFGLIGCGLIGPILSTLFGMILVNQPKRLLVSLIAGIILWSTLLTAVGVISIELLQRFI